MFPPETEELGEADHWIQQSPLRQMPHSYEHTNFETDNKQIYSLINPDDHDRFLTDPAYRMEKAEQVDKTIDTYNEIQEQYIDGFLQDNLGGRIEMSKRTYENLVEAELAIQELDQYT